MADKKKIYLRYVGKGKGTVPGVPARNLTYEETKELNLDVIGLILTGLYEYDAKSNIPEQHKGDLRSDLYDADKPKKKKKESE